MARPDKPKTICRMPAFHNFYSENASHAEILLSVEEYETIYLVDYLGLTQELCAEKMNVSRTVVQALYAQARQKLARFLVEGIPLHISGGNYRVCPEGGRSGSCPASSYHLKGETKLMKIAVTYENGEIFQHFGHTEQFKIYETEGDRILSSEVVDTNGQGHGALAGFLAQHQIDVLICGGIGGGARNALAQAGIRLYPGASGNADAQVESFLKGSLSYDPNTVCQHHSHEDGHDCGSHGEGHSCGGHGEGHTCGEHGCH